MKRCPQCSFLYLDSDQLCDLDKTPLLTEDFGTDVGGLELSEQNAENVQLTDADRFLIPKFNWPLTQRILLAVTVGVFAFGLTSLIAYQRTRSKLQVTQTATTSESKAPQALRVSQVAQQASNEVATKAELGQQPSTSPDPNSTPPSAEPSPSTTAKTTPTTRSESARVRGSSSPVSTSDVSDSASGPVTIQLSDGSMLEADEVWKTKAGIWYRRKGIVTFIKPNRVRTINH